MYGAFGVSCEGSVRLRQNARKSVLHVQNSNDNEAVQRLSHRILQWLRSWSSLCRATHWPNLSTPVYINHGYFSMSLLTFVLPY